MKVYNLDTHAATLQKNWHLCKVESQAVSEEPIAAEWTKSKLPDPGTEDKKATTFRRSRFLTRHHYRKSPRRYKFQIVVRGKNIQNWALPQKRDSFYYEPRGDSKVWPTETDKFPAFNPQLVARYHDPELGVGDSIKVNEHYHPRDHPEDVAEVENFRKNTRIQSLGASGPHLMARMMQAMGGREEYFGRADLASYKWTKIAAPKFRVIPGAKAPRIP